MKQPALVFLFLLFMGEWAFAQETGKPLDFENPEAGDYLTISGYIENWCGGPSIRPDIAFEVGSLLDTLNKLPNWTFQIEVHSDCRASSVYNDSFTQRRADTILSYVISTGFPASRIVAKGMGERQLLLEKCSCDLTDYAYQRCEEKEHSLNRRALIRLVQQMPWIFIDPMARASRTPDKYRSFAIGSKAHDNDEHATLAQLNGYLDSFPDAYFTIHVMTGRWHPELVLPFKRKALYYKAEELREKIDRPSRILIYNEPLGTELDGIAHGFVVRCDSLIHNEDILRELSIPGSSQALVYDAYYHQVEEGRCYEPFPIGGLPVLSEEIPRFVKDIEKDSMILWVVKTDFPAKTFHQCDGKIWNSIQHTDSSTSNWKEAFRILAETRPELNRISEIRYLYVPEVELPYMLILQRKVDE